MGRRKIRRANVAAAILPQPVAATGGNPSLLRVFSIIFMNKGVSLVRKHSGAVLLCTALTAMAGSACAMDALGGWKGEGELGFLRTSGNTDTQSLTAKLGLGKDVGQWRHAGKIEATNTDDHGTTTAERYFAAGKSDYKFSDRAYAYGTIDYEADRFSGYESRINESLGLGYRLINQQNLVIDVEAGPGARQSKLKNGDSESEATLRLGGNLAWKISDTAALTEELSSTIGEENTTTRSLTALTAKISDAFAMKLSYLYKNNSDAPEGFKKTDTETGATLVYSF
jgi:putative salt-induced outer membrane protein